MLFSLAPSDNLVLITLIINQALSSPSKREVGSERVLAPPVAEEASRSSAQRSERTSELRRAKLFQGTASVLGTNDYSNVLFCPEFQGVVGSSP